MQKTLALVAYLLAGSAWAQVEKPDILEVITVDSVISSFTASALRTQVEKINDQPKIKAVLLVIDTPGGGASASAVAREEIAKIKVPVVAYCEYMCASGGVYILTAPSVKYVAVRGDTIGGSVGVVWLHTRFHRLLDWAKIDNETFKSGPLKDSGNPTREMTGDDRKYMQSIVDELAERFYDVVQASRPKADMAELKTAKIFIGKNIVRVGLADSVMSRDDVEKKAKELSGSKLIFTREEIRKMSKAADSGPHHEMPVRRGGPAARGWEADLSTLVDLLQEVRSGETHRVEMRLPYQF